MALRRGSWVECEQHARRALAIDGELTLAWNYLGGALFNQGRGEEAVAALERSVAADPENFDALFNLALVANSLGDGERARTALRRFVREAPASRYGADIARARGWLAEGG